MRPLPEWNLAERAVLTGVLTDIDDTLTTHGLLTSPVLLALAALRDAGLRVIAVTGRPTWWAFPLLKLCGFDGLVAENGASAFWTDAEGRQRSLFFADAAERTRQRGLLDALALRVGEAFPGLQLADDMPMRIGDIAFDIGENRARMSEEEIARVQAFIEDAGFFTNLSSIHLHASVVPLSKQAMTLRFLAEAFGITPQDAREAFVFVGDSINDASMFAWFRHTVGVANIAPYLAALPVPPRWGTQAGHGSGFAELAASLLDAREGVRGRRSDF